MQPEQRSLLKEIILQAHYPTGGDPYIRAFFQTLLKTANDEDSMFNLLVQAQKERGKQKHYLTKAHAVYLPLHIINYIMIFHEHKPDYPFTYSPSLLETTGWQHIFNFVLQKHRPLFMQYLLEKDVQQNIYQRGITIPFLVKTLVGRGRLKVADLGCSANLVWGFILTKSKFDPVLDHTEWNNHTGIVSGCASTEVDVAEMVGIDHHYPQKTEEGKRWLLACRHPREVKPEYIEKTLRLIQEFERLPHISIHEGDFTNPDLKPGYYDIVTMNNTLYQLPQIERRLAINKALESLQNPGGLLVIQDHCFVEKDGPLERLVFTDNRDFFTYRTCIGGPLVSHTFGREWMEIFRFKSTRCLEVKPGRDFNAFMKKALAY